MPSIKCSAEFFIKELHLVVLIVNMNIHYRPTPIKKLPEGQPKVVQSSVPGAGLDLVELIPRPSSVGSGFQPKGQFITNPQLNPL